MFSDFAHSLYYNAQRWVDRARQGATAAFEGLRLHERPYSI